MVKGDEAEIVGFAIVPVNGSDRRRDVSQTMDEVEAGDNIGVLLVVLTVTIERGQVLAKPGTINHTKFSAQIYVLKKEEGGRHTPFFPGYRPQFYFTTDVTGR